MKRVRKLLTALMTVMIVAVCCVTPAMAADSTFRVSIMVIGDSRHKSGAHEEYQVWVDRTFYSVDQGTKGGDLFIMAMDVGGMDYDYAAGYIKAIQAPSVLGGYWLADGFADPSNSNGGSAGWTYTIRSAGSDRHMMGSTGINQYKLSAGDFIVIKYVDDYTAETGYPEQYAPSGWLSAKPLPKDDVITGGAGGGGGGGGAASPAALPVREYTASDIKKIEGTDNWRLNVAANSTIKAGALKHLPAGAAFYADMVADSRIQFRLKISAPALVEGDLKPAMRFETDSGSVTRLFRQYYKNAIKVLAFDQSGSFGQTVDVMVYAGNIEGFDSASWKLYSYDQEKNTYSELAYQVDVNSYIRFSVENGNPIVFSDGAPVK